MKRPRLALLVTLVVLCSSRAVNAFNDYGHRMIALIAYEQLDEESRRSVVDLLKRHPRFDRDFFMRMPVDMQEADEKRMNRWIFAHASTWPDIALGFREPELAHFNHPTWHYINEPLFLDEKTKAKLEGRVRGNLKKDWPVDEDTLPLNALQALKLIEAKFPGDETSAADKAVLICWLFHIAGDIHQPLHGSCLYTRNRFPQGDKGGNQISVKQGGRLHSLWDGSLGRSVRLNEVSGGAASILADPRLVRLGEQAKSELNYELWVKESNACAAEHAYTPAVLEAVADNEDHSGALPPVDLPPEYFNNAGKVSRPRAVKAGYRLAEVIEKLLGE